MGVLIRVADVLAKGLALVAAVGVLLMMFHVGADVVTRNVMGRPFPATAEVVARYYMVMIAFLPLALVERRHAMVSVELLEWAMTPRAMRWSDIAISLFAALVYLLLAWVAWQSALSSWRSGSYVQVLNLHFPVWQSYFLPPLGFVFAAFVTLVRAMQIGLGIDDIPDEATDEH